MICSHSHLGLGEKAKNEVAKCTKHTFIDTDHRMVVTEGTGMGREPNT